MFDPSHPPTFSQGRHGEIYITQGYGRRPQVWRPSSGMSGSKPNFADTGVDAPLTPVGVTLGTGAPTYYVARLDIIQSGQGYRQPPAISIGGAVPSQGTTAGTSTLPTAVRPTGTANATGICRLRQGSISETQMVEYGRGYTSQPDVVLTPTSTEGTNPPTCSPTVTGDCYRPGVLQAVMRATLRGKYLCYYRYIDDTPASEGGPRTSSLSPVLEVDAGDGAPGMTWSFPAPPRAGFKVELWRTSSDQQLILYRVGEFTSAGTLLDDLSDNELLNPLRDGFAALPITLPNGEVNANRFSVPPSDFAVGVFFQDRYWMGVWAPDPANPNAEAQPNTLRFSEQDEPESMPDVNELIVQQNLRSADFITALVPYAGAMLVMQSRHCHRLTYVVQPVIDAGINLFSYRGCCNQRCWDIYEGRCFALDTSGVYSIDPQGQLDDLSVGIDDIFQTKIDWSKKKWFMVRSERYTNCLRVSVAYHGDPGEYPTRQLVYALDYKAWWEERHPTLLTAACDCRLKSSQTALIYGSSSGALFRLNTAEEDIGHFFIASVSVDNPGRGYRRPPKLTPVGGSGAELEAAVDQDGRVTGVLVKHPGTGYSDGTIQVEDPPDGGVKAVISIVTASGAVPVHYSLRTGNMEILTETTDPKDDSAHSRSVSVVFRPTESSSTLHLQTFYNGATHARSNVVLRDRGAGFVHSDETGSSTLEMQATSSQLAENCGVARALFSGRTLEDFGGGDRHVALGLSGKQTGGKVVVHRVDVSGVAGGEG